MGMLNNYYTTLLNLIKASEFRKVTQFTGCIYLDHRETSL